MNQVPGGLSGVLLQITGETQKAAHEISRRPVGSANR